LVGIMRKVPRVAPVRQREAMDRTPRVPSSLRPRYTLHRRLHHHIVRKKSQKPHHRGPNRHKSSSPFLHRGVGVAETSTSYPLCYRPRWRIWRNTVLKHLNSLSPATWDGTDDVDIQYTKTISSRQAKSYCQRLKRVPKLTAVLSARVTTMQVPRAVAVQVKVPCSCMGYRALAPLRTHSGVMSSDLRSDA